MPVPVHAESSTEPQPLSMLGLVGRFRKIHDTMPDRSFCFVLGAGASVTSGIKSANKMVEEWIETRDREETGRTGAVPAGWASDKTLGIKGFDPKDPAGSYSALYRRMFENDPDSGYAYLEDQMKDADPSFGYSVLGRILAQTRHRVVITVNFDNLVADSVSLFSQTYPLVCGHELLAPFVTDKLRRPLVLKVHRDLLLSPMSTPEELAKIDQGFSEAIGRLLRNYTPIVIGYGGNDGSLMRCLEELPERSIPGGIYWCYRDGSGPPPERIRKMVARHRGHLVGIMGFDELLMLFGNELGFDVPDQYVLKRAAERAARIVKQAQELQERIKKRDAEAQKSGPESPKPDDSATGAVTDAMSSTMKRKEAGKRWWQWENEAAAEPDLEKRHEIYRNAIKELPKSAELLNNYAVFLTDLRKDQDGAEDLYKQALETDPKHAYTLGNYAQLLFSTDRVAEGLVRLDAALSNLGDGPPSALHAECWMYAYCCGPVEKRADALSGLKAIVLQTEVRTGDWDFSGVIGQAKKMEHPEGEWLAKLAEVLSGRAAPAALNTWAAWKNAEPKGRS